MLQCLRVLFHGRPVWSSPLLGGLAAAPAPDLTAPLRAGGFDNIMATRRKKDEGNDPEQTSAATGSAAVADPNADDPREGLDQNTEAKKPINMHAVGPKRQLAFALVGVRSLLSKVQQTLAGPVAEGEEDTPEARISRAETLLIESPFVGEMNTALTETGYATLQPRAERIAELQKQLAIEATAGNSAEVIRLAKVMKAVQDGRPEPGTQAANDESEGDESEGAAGE